MIIKPCPPYLMMFPTILIFIGGVGIFWMFLYFGAWPTTKTSSSLEMSVAIVWVIIPMVS